jgi:hypothetical protein
MRRAMERHERGEARVIPVILRACDWKGAPFGKLQALPQNAKPVKSWPDRDEALHDVVRDVRRAVEELARARTLSQPARGSASDSASETLISTSVFRHVHRFTGTVTIDGKPAPDGTRVSAWARSKRWSRSSDPLFKRMTGRDRKASEELEELERQWSKWGEVVKTEVKDWKYCLEVPFDQLLFPSELEVEFRIDDLLVPDQTTTWQDGGNTKLDLPSLTDLMPSLRSSRETQQPRSVTWQDGGSTKLDLTAKSTPAYREAHRFTGTVTIGSRPAPEGTKVSAWRREDWRADLLDRSERLTFLASTSVMHGRYRLLVYASASQLTFMIDDLLIADQTAILEKGGDTQLDLTAEAFRP